jgi:hypothetical protein
MFPTGMAGGALFVLRVLLATTLILDGTVHWAVVTSLWILLVFLLPAVCLCIGFLTPYSAILCCLTQFVVLCTIPQRGGLHLVISLLHGAVVAVLGPGGYSIDAVLFGRRVIKFPSGKSFESR